MLEEFAGPAIATPLSISRGWTRVLLVLLTVLASADGVGHHRVAADQPCGQANQTHHPENILAIIWPVPTHGHGSLARPWVCVFGSHCLFEKRISGLASGVVYVVKVRFDNNWMGVNTEITGHDEEFTFTQLRDGEHLYKGQLNANKVIFNVLPVGMYTIEISLYDGCPYFAASSSEMKQETLLAYSGKIEVTVMKAQLDFEDGDHS